MTVPDCLDEHRCGCAPRINFLNVTIFRENQGLYTNWFRKRFSSGRLLNFFSSHKRTTVLATATHFIQTVLLLSDPRFFTINRPLVIETLRLNCFPETLIMELVHQNYTYMRPVRKANTNFSFYPDAIWQEDAFAREVLTVGSDVDRLNEYVIFPHSICEGRKIKSVIHMNKAPNIVLADSVKNTKINAIRNFKTPTPLAHTRNKILLARCMCRKKVKIMRTEFNETVGIAKSKIITKKLKCDQFSHAYKRVEVRKGLFYANQTKTLLKYIRWKHRTSLDTTNLICEFPMFWLTSLIK